MILVSGSLRKATPPPIQASSCKREAASGGETIIFNILQAFFKGEGLLSLILEILEDLVLFIVIPVHIKQTHKVTESLQSVQFLQKAKRNEVQNLKKVSEKRGSLGFPMVSSSLKWGK